MFALYLLLQLAHAFMQLLARSNLIEPVRTLTFLAQLLLESLRNQFPGMPLAVPETGSLRSCSWSPCATSLCPKTSSIPTHPPFRSVSPGHPPSRTQSQTPKLVAGLLAANQTHRPKGAFCQNDLAEHPLAPAPIRVIPISHRCNTSPDPRLRKIPLAGSCWLHLG